jgi:pyruvate,orthophosphate dikinase
MEMKDLLGGKGANLAEMMSVLRLPVPHGFTITTDACRAYMHGGWPKTLDAEVAKHVAALERKMGRKLGDANDPLLVSVRSGAKFSMPGMMDTVLNLGLNDRSVVGLARSTGDERFAYDSYRRFISMYGRIVLGIDGHVFEEPLEAAKARAGVRTDADVPASVLRELCVQGRRREAHGPPLPAGTCQAAARRNRGRVPVVERPACDCLPRAGEDQPRARHRCERAGDGVRQP